MIRQLTAVILLGSTLLYADPVQLTAGQPFIAPSDGWFFSTKDERILRARLVETDYIEKQLALEDDVKFEALNLQGLIEGVILYSVKEALEETNRIVQETVADYCNKTNPEDVTALAPIVIMENQVKEIRALSESLDEKEK